jgi:hypothetical protein
MEGRMIAWSLSESRAVMLMVCVMFAETELASAQHDNVTAAAGGSSVSGNVCLSFTVGESVVQGGAVGNVVLKAGFQQPSSYDLWSNALGLTFGPNADPDGDGSSNLLEFAFGTNPLSSASRAQPAGSFGPGQKYYITANKGTSVGDLLWSAEASTDLVTWSSQPVTVAINDNFVFSALYTGSAPAAFLRLRVSPYFAK